MTPTPWILSAPATLVLLWGPETSDASVLKLALVELIVRGDLVLETATTSGWFGRSRSSYQVKRGAAFGAERSSALRVVRDALSESRVPGLPAPSISIPELGQRVFTQHMQKARSWRGNRYRQTGLGYMRASVLPELVAGGLFEERAPHGRWQFGKATEWDLAPGGEATLADLRARLDTCRTAFPGMVQTSPAEAYRFVTSAGTIVLLARQLAWSYRQLSAWVGHERRQGREPDAGLPEAQYRRDQVAVEASRLRLDDLARGFGPEGELTVDDVFQIVSDEIDRGYMRLRRGGWWFGFGE
jgi:hypothetical protein